LEKEKIDKAKEC